MNYIRKIINLLTSMHFWDPGVEWVNEYCKGVVLNAGSGTREFIKIEGEVSKIINLDIIKSKNIDLLSDLHNIPLKDGVIDTIVNIAVLEHVERPWICVQEMYRVLKPNGIVVCDAPFMQPKHGTPRDYYRYTDDGLRAIFENNGFKVVKTGSGFNYFHTWSWITYEYLKKYKVLYPILIILNPLLYLLQRLKIDVETCRSANHVIAKKI